MALERFAHVATCLSLTHADFADCNDDNDKDNGDSESDNVRPARPYPMAQLHKWRSHKRDDQHAPGDQTMYATVLLLYECP